MYTAMKRAFLRNVPKGSPGLTVAEIEKRLVRHLPQKYFPGAVKAGWWAKTVQLDLEAERRHLCLAVLDRWHIGSHNPKLGLADSTVSLCPGCFPTGGISLDIEFHRNFCPSFEMSAIGPHRAYAKGWKLHCPSARIAATITHLARVS